MIDVDPNVGIVTHVEALGRLVARRDPSSTEFLHVDHLGSIRLVTDDSGNLVEETDFDAWGRARLVNGAAQTTCGFVGGDADDGTELVYLGARYFEPAQRRMVSPDSLIPDVFTPQALNPYAFVLNDPVTLIDPSGHAPINPEDEWAPWPEPPTAIEPALTPPPLVQVPPSPESVEVELGRNGPYAGLTPEARAANEFWDADARVGDWISNNIMPKLVGASRLVGAIDPTGLLDSANDLVDENMGWGDSSAFVGGRTFLMGVGVVTGGPMKLGKWLKALRRMNNVRLLARLRFTGVLKIRIPLSALKAGERKLIEDKYKMANKIIREGLVDARAGQRLRYNRDLSRQFIKEFDDVSGPVSDVRIPAGWNVDEYLSRYFGGPQMLFNQQKLPAVLNQSLGSWEKAAVHNSGVLDGDAITKFVIEWTK